MPLNQKQTRGNLRKLCEWVNVKIHMFTYENLTATKSACLYNHIGFHKLYYSNNYGLWYL